MVRSACGRRDGPVAGRSCAEIPQNVPACGEGCGGGLCPGRSSMSGGEAFGKCGRAARTHQRGSPQCAGGEKRGAGGRTKADGATKAVRKTAHEDGARKAAQPMRRSTGDAAKTRRGEREPPRPRHGKRRPARDLCSLSPGGGSASPCAGRKKTRRSFWKSAAFLLCRRRSAIWPAARIRPRSRPDCRRDPPR